VMQLRRAYLPDPLPPAAAAQLEEAKRRCLACKAGKLCDEALAAGDAHAFSLFCPNSYYMQQVKGARLRFS
jgi:hypothetical protein